MNNHATKIKRVKDFLNPRQETIYKKLLIDKYGLTYANVGKFLGQSRQHTRNILNSLDNISDNNRIKLVLLVGILDVEAAMDAEVGSHDG